MCKKVDNEFTDYCGKHTAFEIEFLKSHLAECSEAIQEFSAILMKELGADKLGKSGTSGIDLVETGATLDDLEEATLDAKHMFELLEQASERYWRSAQGVRVNLQLSQDESVSGELREQATEAYELGMDYRKEMNARKKKAKSAQ